MNIRKLLLEHNIIKESKEDQENKSWLKSLAKWNLDWGDVTRRLNYKLNEESIVFDIGGYKGQWASDIYAMFRCRIYVFEPIKKYADFIRQRLNFPNKIVVETAGASIANRSQYLFIDNEKSSSNLTSEAEKMSKVKVKMIDLCEYITRARINSIDLMKINIEGDEYDLLEKLISTGTINKVKNLQVQFHRFIERSKERRNTIRTQLSRTHKETYNYPFIWESWEIKQKK